ncbi:hypothetical protein RhiJN_18701 [Ceratobasidium sp. AG-Ba]|nr:hypothetical protein RhiJN_18701 [Ceratobasidium sp. AG-Ba]
MTLEHPTANRISVNSAQQDDQIESVTVFQTRAEVKRRIQVELRAGQNHVEIEKLPNCVIEDSIRVDGTGSAVIFDVTYHRPVRQHSNPNPSNSEAVAEASRVVVSLQKERELIQEQSNMLSAYGKTLDSKSISIDDVGRFLDIFGPRKVALDSQIQELDSKIHRAQKELEKAQALANGPVDILGAKRGTKVTVTVLADADGPAELMLTYTVSNASWTPLYDVRASTAKSPDAKSAMALHYRASITQTTGENWPDVALTLSTASPQLGGKVPEISTCYIGFQHPPSGGVLASACLDSGTSALRARSAGARGPSAPAMRFSSAEVIDNGILSAVFGISGLSNVPSDEGSHKVVITVLNLAAQLEWMSVPRKKQNAFLTCEVVNTSEYTLLPGEANVFMDDSFVTKSRIQHVAPNESFKTSLGVDPGLRITYPAVRVLNKTTDSSYFFSSTNSKQLTKTHSQRITIRNLRPSLVSGLRIFDRVPVSDDTQIKVNVVTPDGLGSVIGENEDSEVTKDRTWKSVQKGVKARWADLDVGGEGIVEWACDVQPNGEIHLEFVWEVNGPAGQKWQTW